MQDVVVEETIEDMDIDKDGKLSLQEFINDLWRVRYKIEDTIEFIDIDKDGKLSLQEFI